MLFPPEVPLPLADVAAAPAAGGVELTGGDPDELDEVEGKSEAKVDTGGADGITLWLPEDDGEEAELLLLLLVEPWA